MRTIKFTSICTVFVLCSVGLAFTSCYWQFNYNDCDYNNAIKGNQKLITQEINITDYDKIELIGNMMLNYQQSDKAPYFQITIDDNLLSYIDIYVENKTLIIAPKRNKTRHIVIRPTKCIINTNSTGLINVNNLGSGIINFVSDIKTDKLVCAVVGSGNITSTTSVTAEQLDVKVSGSGNTSLHGDIGICNISIAGSGGASLGGKTNNCKVNVSGSGSASLGGEINTCDIGIAGSGEASFNGKADNCKLTISGSGEASLSGEINTCNIGIVGSGKIGSYNCSVKDLTCKISGSGDVKLHVENTISCSISGSGSLQYTGNPVITKQIITGSGKIIKQ
ncbi:MAG: DUF2807 domain-containing protein [Bacteroidales bacterium]|nr:DUF2807 domain-containing protein [Bacteroidales bacterium]